jgi:hypothetical protein
MGRRRGREFPKSSLIFGKGAAAVAAYLLQKSLIAICFANLD